MLVRSFSSVLVSILTFSTKRAQVLIHHSITTTRVEPGSHRQESGSKTMLTSSTFRRRLTDWIQESCHLPPKVSVFHRTFVALLTTSNLCQDYRTKTGIIRVRWVQRISNTATAPSTIVWSQIRIIWAHRRQLASDANCTPDYPTIRVLSHPLWVTRR